MTESDREEQKMKVVKFGGSSMADAGQYRKVRDILLADPERRVVVVSAAGKRSKDDHKITDLLYLCYAHIKYGVSCMDVFEQVKQRYLDIRDELGLTTPLEAEFDALWERMQHGIGEDELVSRGEYFSARLLADALGYDFIDAKLWLTFALDGSIDEEASYSALRRIAANRRAVIPGFYGIAPGGRILTLTRGGSDVTGALAAAALDADVYENWTDVSGFKMADPRIVDDPLTIKTITYRELRELSYMGATVLHEEAIFPVRYAGIPINIRNTLRPQDPGTMIVAAAQDYDSEHVITGVAGKRGFTVITLEQDMMNSEPSFGRRVLEIFEEYGITFEHLPSGIDTMSVVLETATLEGRRDRILNALRRALRPDSITVEDNVALIAVVGRGMVKARGTAARIFAAISAAGVNIRMIDQGSSELNIIIGVEEHDFENALRAIYSEFVKNSD